MLVFRTVWGFGESEPQAMLLTKNVKKKDGKLLGLLIHAEHAMKFLAEPMERKVYEIRSRPLNFLEEGDQIALISVESNPCRWRVIGILEFQASVKIKWALFDKHFQLHRVPCGEALIENMKEKHDHCFGWHFELAHTCKPPLVFKDRILGPQVWVYFSVGHLEGVSVDADEVLPRKRSAESSDMDSFKRSKTSQSGLSSDATVAAMPLHLSSEDIHAVEEPTNEDADGNILEICGDNLLSIVLKDSEWCGICKGGTSILKPYRTAEGKLHVLVSREAGLFFVGVIRVADCQQVEPCKLGGSWPLDMYSQYDLKHMKSLKRLYQRSVDSVDAVNTESLVRPLQTKHSGKAPFWKARSDFMYTPASPPTRLCLKETARYFFDACGENYQQILLENLKSLDGKTIKIGTACSGTDICVEVLKQTVEFFNKQQAGGQQPLGVHSF